MTRTFTFDGFIDGDCGWEFEAPLHAWCEETGLHFYSEVGSICPETAVGFVEDLLCDDDKPPKGDENCWPYESGMRNLRRRYLRAKKGKGKASYFRVRATIVDYPSKFETEILDWMHNG